MELDTSSLEQGVTLRYDEPKLPCFRRYISRQEPLKTRILYHFGFPRINRKRFAKVDIYDRNAKSLPAPVKDYFLEINDDQFCAYLYQFYPNGCPNKSNFEIIKRREGNGTGTAGYKLLCEDLVKIRVKNVFITPTNEKMIQFLERKGFDKIVEGRPWKDFALTVSIYGKVL